MKKIRRINTKKVWIAIDILLAILLLVSLGIFIASVRNTNTDPAESDSVQETQGNIRLPDLLGRVRTIKADLVSALEDIKQSNWASARSKLDRIRNDIVSVRTWVEKIPLLTSLVPQAESIYELLNAADMAISEIAMPAMDLLETHPISGLSVGDGFDMKLLCSYIDFIDSVMPKLENLMETANSVDFSIVDSEGKIAGYLEKGNELLAIYHENPEILSMLKAMLGAEEDRLYLIAVQNPSEIRAAGGFPGFMGMLRIEDGVLTLGEFSTVLNFLSHQKPENIEITQEEMALFHHLSGIQTPYDAELCPDFERVGHIWASSYEAWHPESVAGVISMTPHLVQRLLAVTGEEITLFDGLVLNGENALKVLIHDIYFRYFNRNNTSDDKYVISDLLFAEAAQKTMETITGDISLSRVLGYLPVMKESFDDRTLMLWMKDEKEQAFIVQRGWSGGLNRDPQNPEAGVYVNVVSASKMGWFLLVDTQIGERTKNADGSYTYPVTVTFANNITSQEINIADSTITADLGGGMYEVAYFFAPAGGSVGNFSATNGQAISIKTYNGMTLGFMDMFLIRPGTPVTVTYIVTTAPGVETPLTISQTPTAQKSE